MLASRGQSEVLQPHLGGVRRRCRQAGEHTASAPAGHRQGRANVGRLDHCGRDHDGVGHDAASQLPHQLVGIGSRCRRVGGAETRRGCPLELDRVDRDDAGGAADPRALDGRGADAAGADSHHRVFAAHFGATRRRAVSGWVAPACPAGCVRRRGIGQSRPPAPELRPRARGIEVEFLDRPRAPVLVKGGRAGSHGPHHLCWRGSGVAESGRWEPLIMLSID